MKGTRPSNVTKINRSIEPRKNHHRLDWRDEPDPLWTFMSHIYIIRYLYIYYYIIWDIHGYTLYCDILNIYEQFITRDIWGLSQQGSPVVIHPPSCWALPTCAPSADPAAMATGTWQGEDHGKFSGIYHGKSMEKPWKFHGLECVRHV